MNSLRNTIKYPDYTQDAIKAIFKSSIGQNTVFCVVEAPDDIEVYDKIFNSTVSIHPSDIDGNRSYRNVESIVTDLNDELDGIALFGIRDADYTRYTSYVCPDNVFMTDERDLEIMMLRSSSVSATLPQYDFANKIVLATATTRYLGYLRIFNEVKQTSCSFKNKVAKTSLMWNEQSHFVPSDYSSRQFAEFKLKCDANPECRIEVTEDMVNTFISDYKLESEPYYNICRGHDVVKLLARMMFGTNYGDRKKLQQHLVDSYSFEDFAKTRLYAEILLWASNKGVEVY